MNTALHPGAAEEYRVLMLEDSDDDAKLIERALRAGGIACTPVRVDTREAYTRALEATRPDVVLADYSVPGLNGLEALRLARALRPDTPLIVVTGTLDDEAAVELLHEGAHDYVLKDRLSRLGAAVRRAIERAHEREAQRSAQQELHEQLDELRRFQTAAVDRELRMAELEEEIARLKRAQAR